MTLEQKQIAESKETERYGADRAKLIPTPTGEQVTDFLVAHFPNVVDYSFTAEVEDQLDRIADGQAGWQKIVKDFYGPFHKTIKAGEEVKRSEAAQARLVGHDPKDKEPIFARYGRYGPMLQKGEGSEDEKPRFAPLPPGERLETITLETALKALTLPRVIGDTDEGEEISVNIGRYGPYLKVGKQFTSLKEDDPYTIELARAKEVLAAATKQAAQKYVKRFEADGIDIVNGRYGPYVTDGKKNASIPGELKPAEVDLEKAKQLLAQAPARKKRFRRKKS